MAKRFTKQQVLDAARKVDATSIRSVDSGPYQVSGSVSLKNRGPKIGVRQGALITSREAKRLALVNIVGEIEAGIDAKTSAWRLHPETGERLPPADAALIGEAARRELVVLERRASRLRSVGRGGAA